MSIGEESRYCRLYLMHNLTAKQSNMNSPECNSGDVGAYVSQPREGLNFALHVLFHIQPLAGYGFYISLHLKILDTWANKYFFLRVEAISN